MPSLRRSVLRRYRLLAPYLFRHGLLLLLLLLVCDGISVLYFPQLQEALSLQTPLKAGPTIGASAFNVAAMTGTGVGVATVADDTFQRPDQRYWGTASDGEAWQGNAANARNFVVFADSGVIEATAPRVYSDALLGPRVSNVELTFNASLSQYGPSLLGAVLRWSDANNFYALTLDGQNLALIRTMDGMQIPLQSVALPARVNALYTFRFRAVGTQLCAMVWPTGQPAPANWQIVVSDSALTGGQAGLRVLVQNNAQARITAFKEVQL